MKKTYIYIKRLPHGLMYLGKTVKNPYKYYGSGSRWLDSINFHKYTISDIETWILHETIDNEDLVNMGRYYSKLFNVRDSKLWANLKDEEGTGWGVGDNHHYRLKPETNPCLGRVGKKHPMYGKIGIINPSYGQKRPLVSAKLIGNDYGKNNKGNKRPDLAEKNKINNPAKNPEIMKKILETKSKKPKNKCEYCNKEFDTLNFIKWHGNNCKFKK